MHRLFLGCNLWNAVFLTTAACLGAAGSPLHARVSLFAALFSCLVQCGIIALFLGAAKLTKEHVGRFGMSMSLIDRLNEIYRRLIPAASIGAVSMAAVSVLGGAADLGLVPIWLHVLPATAALLYMLAIIPFEYRLQVRMHAVIGDVERLIPPPARISESAPHPGYRPDRVVLDRAGRGKALLYIGLTLPLPYLGYTFISGHDVSYLLVPTLVLTAGCLGAAARELWTSRGSRPDAEAGGPGGSGRPR